MENNGTTTKLNDQESVLEALRKEVQKRCPEGVRVEIQEMKKNNGVVKQGMAISGEDNRISPVIYLKPYLEIIEKEESSIEEMANFIYAFYQNHRKEEADLVNRFQNVELVKERIIYQLVSLERNREWLRSVPHRVVGEDLAAVFALLCEKNSCGMMTVKMKKEYKNLWEIDEEELWELAAINTPKLFPAVVESLEDVLLGLMRTQLEANGIVFNEKAWAKQLEARRCPMGKNKNFNLQMYVLSNQCRTWGASVILYPGVLRGVAEKLGGDLLILPSSIHEVIVMRRENGTEYDKMTDIVKEINQKEVMPEEVLSDAVYLYCRKDDSLCRITGKDKEEEG